MDISLLEETIMLYTETKELQKYRDSKRLWQGIPSIEVTKRGRIFLTFYSGGVKEEIGNYVIVIKSDDGGNHFSEPIVIVKEDSKIKDAADLTKKGANNKIGVQLGTTGDLYCTDDVENAGLGKVEKYNKGADAVQALVSGKIDCVVIDNQPAKEFVKANKGLKILDTAYAEEDYAIALAKDNSELRDKINNALKELKADGTIQKILDKYITAE